MPFGVTAVGTDTPYGQHRAVTGAGPDVSEEAMLQYIVENVNTVLGEQYSLVDFDELSENRLLHVLANIFLTLSPTQNLGDIEKGDREPLYTFLIRTIGYKIPPIISHSFQESFYNADKSVIYPVMYWVLQNLKQCRKRVYLARFLTRLDIPEQVRMSDERVRELYQHYESLRADFIQTHKRVDSLRETHADPAEARRRISGLQSEKEKLQSYIEAAQRKIANVPNTQALLTACKLLRTEKEEEAKLKEKYSEQQEALFAVERRHTEVTHRLKHAQRDLQDGKLESIVSRLKDEMFTNSMKLEDQIPKELNEKQAENAALQKLLSEPLDFPALNMENDTLDADICDLQKKIIERQRPSDDGNSIQMMRDQVKLVVKKKNEILQELNGINSDNERAIGKLRETESQIEQFRDQKVLSGQEFRVYSNQVRSKTTTTKTMKQKLGDLRAEWGVLSYTQKTLEVQFEDLRSEIQKIEETMGIRGYSDEAEKLDRVTDEKNAIEEVKGRTLEELSRIVQDIMVNIRDRRNKLNPQINELRSQRQVAAEVDQEWEERKSQYELQEGLLMQDVTIIESEVNILEEETRINEGLYHRLNNQKLLMDVMLHRAQEEKSYRASQSSLDINGCKTYSQLIDRTMQDVEKRSKDLQRRRRDIDENHETNVQQVEWFNNLRKILEVKVHCMKTTHGEFGDGIGICDGNTVGPRGTGNNANDIENDINAVMGRGDGGVNVLNLNGGY
eukprot:Tbor_TRINITY_DN252_c0_g1::TRINITY_DN252_c0_g1_i1::g.12196::m.12196/K19677/IFT81; intraflagellar transport protein 81